jgi:integrase
MPASDSTSRTKPAKPYADFPLFPHAAGVWAKKIRGKLHYFGPWEDPEIALARYLEQKDDLHAGRAPRTDPAALTLSDLVNEFLHAKQALVDTGELSAHTWFSYNRACLFLVGQLGKKKLVAELTAADFARVRNKLAERFGPHGLGTAIQCIRCACKYAYDAQLIDQPIRYGPNFKRPSKKTMRLHRANQGLKLFSAKEIRALIQGALVVGTEGPELVQPGMQLKAMVLLGINCGFGNADCARLPLDAIDWTTGSIDYPRPKTGIPRRCILWPETLAAIQEAIAHRPEPKTSELAGRVFITHFGGSWAKDTPDCPIAKESAKLLHRLGINSRKGLGFYTLRHTFRTVADEVKDQPAVDFIMGHEVPHMSSVYRETINTDRLRAVADYVRRWLFPQSGSPEQ